MVATESTDAERILEIPWRKTAETLVGIWLVLMWAVFIAATSVRCASAQITTSDNVFPANKEDERKAVIDGKTYSVRYDICMACMATVPATYDAQVHYPAKASVYLVDSGAGELRTILGELPTEWTARGCFEDDPKYLVSRVLQLRKIDAGTISPVDCRNLHTHYFDYDSRRCVVLDQRFWDDLKRGMETGSWKYAHGQGQIPVINGRDLVIVNGRVVRKRSQKRRTRKQRPDYRVGHRIECLDLAQPSQVKPADSVSLGENQTGIQELRARDTRSCEERIRVKFLQMCGAGQCARMDVDVVTPDDCHHLSTEARLAAAKGGR